MSSKDTWNLDLPAHVRVKAVKNLVIPVAVSPCGSLARALASHTSVTSWKLTLSIHLLELLHAFDLLGY